MEFRYVYRKIEDRIGVPLDVEDAPHVRITRTIREDFRELKDIARHTELQALCLSSLAGNSGIDPIKTNSRVTDLLDTAFSQRVPYFKPPERQPVKSAEQEMEDNFKFLHEWTKSVQAQQNEAEIK